MENDTLSLKMVLASSLYKELQEKYTRGEMLKGRKVERSHCRHDEK